MRACAIVAVVFGLAGLTGPARGADDNKELIVGTWEMVYSQIPAGIPVGIKLEFTADGKVMLTFKDKDGQAKTEGIGGYKVEGTTLILTGKDNSKNDKGRIVLLNKSSFVINDEVLDKVMVLKKVEKP